MTRLAEAQTYHAACMERLKTRPVPAGQKFQPGDRVHIAEDLGPTMAHFPAGRDATVRYTHAHAFGPESGEQHGLNDYCLDIDGIGEVSWYYEHQLTLIV